MSNSTIANTFYERLRSETGEAHRRLEALPISQKLLSETLTSHDFIQYLTGMASVILASERDVMHHLTPYLTDLEQRRKFYLIENDLEFLKQDLAPTPFAFDVASTAHAFGIIYVVEGSTLGGRYILNHVQKTVQYDAIQGASYFAGYGNQSGAMWKIFLNTLLAYASQGHSEAIIDGANYAFAAIHKHLKAV